MLTLTPDEILNEMGDYPMGKGGNYRETPKPNKPEPKPGEDGSKFDAKGRPRFNPLNKDPYSGKTSKYDEEYKGSGTPEQQAAMKAQVEVSKKVNRYGGKTPSGTTAVDAKKGIEDVRKSM